MRNIRKTHSISNYVLYGCVGILVILMLVLVLPVVPSKVSAAPSSAVSTQSVVDFSTTIKPSISISVASKVDLSVAPSVEGSFSTALTQVTVATNSREGYSLYLESAGDTNALMPVYNKNNTDVIQALEGNTTENNFPSNHWGFSITGPGTTDMGYQPVPLEAADAVIGSSTPYQTDNYDLTFAVKVDTTLATDTYAGAVIVSAVANPVAAANLAELIYMQDMTSSICENTMDYVDKEHYITKQLVDTRDGKSYWVAKLADGNCWMVQNLALDIPADYATQFTSSNTDIPEGWGWPYFSTANDNKGFSSLTQQRIGVSFPDIGFTYTETYSWNLGKWVLALPNIGVNCGQKVTSIATCTKVGLVDVSDSSKWQPLWTAQDGTWTIAGQSSPTAGYVAAHLVSEEDLVDNPEWEGLTGVYDPHYLVGNYYSWNTAAAGSGGNIVNADAVWSICPKGWKLPTDLTSRGRKSFEGLYSLYSNFTELPLAFTASGHTSHNDQITALYNTGTSGYLWSSRADNSSSYSAYELNVTRTSANMGSSAHTAGFSIRCLTR